jgi:hypothetical protein
MATKEQLDYWKSVCKKYRETPKAKILSLLKTTEKRSIKKGWEFDLTKEWLSEKVNKGVCELSKIPFLYSKGTQKTHFNPLTPSIDRIDSSKGYTKDNCRVVLAAVNMGIGEWGLEMYLKIASKVIENQKK